MNKIKEQNLMYIICAIVILYSIYINTKRKDYLKTEYKFTVGNTIKYEFNDGHKDCVEYQYYVDNVKYVDCETIDPKICCPLNKFYRVKYSKIKPEISELQFIEQVIDSEKITKAGFNYKKNN